MADMELVIKIPEEMYQAIKGSSMYISGRRNGKTIDYTLFKAVKNGTPLEKHDEEVIKETVESIWGKPPYTEMLDKIRAEIEQLPTTKCTETHRIYIDADDFKKNVLVILDKYKAESEEEE